MKEQLIMTTISDEKGILNNFAKEPAMYYAEAPTGKEQRNYIIWGAIASVLVFTSVATAVVIS